MLRYKRLCTLVELSFCKFFCLSSFEFYCLTYHNNSGKRSDIVYILFISYLLAKKVTATPTCINGFFSHLFFSSHLNQPELTVENLPWYLELRKPLLIMFVGGEENPETLQSVEEMKKAERTGQLDSALPCWIHL